MSKTATSLHWAVLTAALAGLALLVAILFFFDPSSYGFYPGCLLHKATGLQCPGCGSLRAMHQLLHGHLSAALHFNALLVLSLPLCGWYVGVCALRRFRHQPIGLALPAKWIWLFAGMALLFGIWRNLPGSPFAMLPR